MRRKSGRVVIHHLSRDELGTTGDDDRRQQTRIKMSEQKEIGCEQQTTAVRR